MIRTPEYYESKMGLMLEITVLLNRWVVTHIWVVDTYFCVAKNSDIAVKYWTFGSQIVYYSVSWAYRGGKEGILPSPLAGQK
jgi:hypothetical protein